MNSLAINLVGAAAALCSMSSFLPQVFKIIRERDAEQVSLRMYVVTVTGFSLWTAYGLMLASWPLVLSNLVSLGLSATVLGLKLRYGRKKKGPQSPAAPSAAEPEGSI
jgi:MtN3 and saliva related transmembrane protein